MLIGVVISDVRQEKISELLKNKGISVIDIMTNEDFSKDIDVLVLPIRGINENCILKINNSVLDFSSFFKTAKKEMVIYCGVTCKYLEQLPFKVINILNDEEITEYNSKLTAQGLLIDLLTNIDRAIDEITIDIIGFGHCGKAIYRMFSKLCPNIRIVSSQNLSEFEDFPVDILDYEAYKKAENYADIIINTAPTLIFDNNLLDRINKETIILDIASSPGGTDFVYAAKKGITALLLPALPAKYVGGSAGYILGQRIVKDVESHD